ncbi:helix-turn-helix domain-containing protein [Carboxydothermus islandicus]|nr:helix-turn-helix transcriptional regulator [Carboxydothermus islandicus]
MDIRQFFGKKLRELRKSQGLTQKELGRRLNVTEAAVGMWEQGRRLPDPEVLARLAEIFGVSVDYLLGNNQQASPSTPSWWYRDTPPTNVELEEFLKNANIYFDGTPLDEEDKEDILTYLKVKWEREKKKREKDSKK